MIMCPILSQVLFHYLKICQPVWLNGKDHNDSKSYEIYQCGNESIREGTFNHFMKGRSISKEHTQDLLTYPEHAMTWDKKWLTVAYSLPLSFPQLTVSERPL
jgi:hypothetical protein